MTPVLARIIARYIASALVTYGIIAPEYGSGLDADLSMAIGFMISGTAEGGYYLAKRFGWRT